MQKEPRPRSATFTLGTIGDHLAQPSGPSLSWAGWAWVLVLGPDVEGQSEAAGREGK